MIKTWESKIINIKYQFHEKNSSINLITTENTSKYDPYNFKIGQVKI